jgi:hypothetical protein
MVAKHIGKGLRPEGLSYSALPRVGATPACEVVVGVGTSLLVADGAYWVGARGAAGREVTGGKSHSGQEGGCGD